MRLQPLQGGGHPDLVSNRVRLSRAASKLAALPPAILLGVGAAGLVLSVEREPRRVEPGPIASAAAPGSSIPAGPVATMAPRPRLDAHLERDLLALPPAVARAEIARRLEPATPDERARLVRALRRLDFTASPLALADQPEPDPQAIAEARAPDSLPAQARLMADTRRSRAIRRAAGCALGSVHTARSLALLVDASRSPDPTTRELAAEMLGAWPRGGAAREHLVALLSDPVATVRAASARALAWDPSVRADLTSRLLAETDPQVVEVLARGLAATGGAEALAPLTLWAARCEEASRAARAICAREGLALPAGLR